MSAADVLRSRVSRLARALAASIALCSAPVDARAADPPPDELFTRSGDHLTGELKGLGRGRLRFDTPATGEIPLEWDEVARVRASGTYEVEGDDGRVYLGTIACERDRELVVTTAGGVVALPMDAIVRLTRIHETAFDRWSIALDAGSSFSRSSDLLSIVVNAAVEYRRPRTTLWATVHSNSTWVSGQEGGRQSATVGGTRRLRERWFLLALADFQRNLDLGLDQRLTVLGGPGRFLRRTSRTEIGIAAGPAVWREKVFGAAAGVAVSPFVALRGDYFTDDDPETDISWAVTAFPLPTDAHRRRFESEVTARRDLGHDFYVAVHAYDTFTNTPLLPGGVKNDIGGTVTLGWSF